LDVVADDCPHHIDAYRKNFAGKVCMFHAPWNRETQVDNTKVYRIKDWYEFENLIPKLKFTSPFRNLLSDINAID